MEGQARGRHLLGRRVGAVRETRRPEAPAEGRDLTRRLGVDPGLHRQAEADPAQGQGRLLDRHRAEPYGLVYHPKKIQRLGIAEPREWDDLLNPKLRGEVAQCAPTRSSSSNATYEVILSMYGEDKGWDWLKKLAANTGHFTARSRDVPTVVAKGEYTAGFAVPSYMAFEEKLAGFDLKFVAPKNAFVTPEPMAILAGARNPKAARAFIEFLLTERGQMVFMERGLFPITPKYKVQGSPGSTAELAVQFTGGLRSYFDTEVSNVYDEGIAAKRSEALKIRFRSEIEAVWKKP